MGSQPRQLPRLQLIAPLCNAIHHCIFNFYKSLPSSTLQSLFHFQMVSRALRRFGTTAYKMAEAASHAHTANPYGIRVATAQQHVNGFVGGMSPILPFPTYPSHSYFSNTHSY